MYDEAKELIITGIIIVFVILMILAMVFGLLWLSEIMDIHFMEKKIETLKEQELINNEVVQVLIQDMKL